MRVDPTSAIAWSQLGDEYQARERLSQGQEAFERALALKPGTTAAQVGLGIIAGKQERWADVERHLRPVLTRMPDLFEQGQRRIPRKRDVYSVNVAVLSAQAGRWAEATRRLEGLVGAVDERAEPGMLKAWWYLAELYRAQTQNERARAAYTRYLELSARSEDAHVRKLRELARQALAMLERR